MDDLDDANSPEFFDTVYKKVKNRARMKEVVKEFLANSEYSAAREVLQSLLPLQESTDDRLTTYFQIAECDIMLNRQIHPQTDREIMSLMEASGKTHNDLQELAEQGNGTEQAVSFFYACKLVKSQLDPDQAVTTMERYIMRSTHGIKKMRKNPITQHAVGKASSLMAEMIKEMKGIEGADVHAKTRSQATCLARVAYILNKLEKVHDAYKLLLEGREMMQRELGAEASRYHVSAALAHNIAATLVRRGKFAEAASYHEEAIREMEEAQDISEMKRQEELGDFRQALEHERHMESWLKSQGQDNQVAIEMACEEAYRQAKAAKGSRSTPTPDPSNEGLAFLRNMLEQATTTTETPVVEEEIPVDAAIRDILDGGAVKESTNEKILSEFQTRDYSWQKIRKMAADRSGAGAVVLHLYTCKLLPFSEAPEKVVKEIGESFRLSRNTIEEMNKGSGAAVAKKLVSLLHEMLRELNEVPNGNAALKAQTKASSLNKLGSLYIQLGEYAQAVKYLTEGRQAMVDLYGGNAAKHTVYASLANNIGYAHGKAGAYVQSAEFYAKAFSEMQKVEDTAEINRKEKLNAYKKGFESALSGAEKNDPRKAEEIRRNFASHEIMKSASKRVGSSSSVSGLTATSPTSPRAAQPSDVSGRQNKILELDSSPRDYSARPQETTPARKPRYPLVAVGSGIYVDHTKPLREGYQVFVGELNGEAVAVKKIDFSETHRHEIEIMEKLKKHPNTVEYKAWSEWESKEMPGIKAIYLAMELCGEETLCESATDEAFTMDQRISALLQFTRGLDHIHKNNIIHGDLKPHNLLRSLQEGVIKVGDFGISKKLEWGRTHVTMKTQRGGTYGWMAPDQNLTTKYDIFSAGLIYYFVLSGGKELDDITDLTSLNCPYLDITRDLISRMIDPDPSKRPTAEECMENPIFWNDKKKTAFICELSDHFSRMRPDAETILLVNKDQYGVVDKGWVENLVNFNPAQPHIGEDVCSEMERRGEILGDMASDYSAQELISLLKFISHCIPGFERDEKQIRNMFATIEDIITFFDACFPKLLLAAYEVARGIRYFWPAVRKLDFLRDVSEQPISQCEIRLPKVFEANWLEELVLDKTAVALAQEKSNAVAKVCPYKISKFSVYNMAVSNDRKEEGEYDVESTHSLLRFISNRRKFFDGDGMVAKCVFGDDTEGLWGFFSSAFPNLFDDIVVLSAADGQSVDDAC